MADALTTLRRLRHLQSDQAKRALAETLTAERAADARLRQANTIIAREAATAPTDAAHPLSQAYAAWLPAARHARVRLAATLSAAQTATETARAALTEARAAERAADTIAHQRAAAARHAALKQAQITSDDRPRGSQPPAAAALPPTRA